MDKHVAGLPLASSYTESVSDVLAVEESIGLAEVIAQSWVLAWDTDIVDVELGAHWVSKN